MSILFFSKYYEIKKRCQNLLDLKLHFWYACACLHSSWTAVQVQMLLLDTFYHHTGPSLSFHIWMSYYMLENIGTCQCPETKEFIFAVQGCGWCSTW